MGSPSGTDAETRLISTVAHLNEIRDTPACWAADITIEQTADIDYAGQDAWTTSIGTSSSPFRGRYDGGGFAIRNLTINRPSGVYVGLFGYVQAGVAPFLGPVVFVASAPATSGIVNLVLHDIRVVGDNYVGGLVGRLQDPSSGNPPFLIEDVRVTNARIRAFGDYAGGLIGYGFEGPIVIRRSHVSGVVAASEDYAGGLIGYVDADNGLTIEESSFVGRVSAGEDAGGLIGRLTYANTSTISKSFAIARVTADDYAGGLVGYISSYAPEIRDSYALGRVQARLDAGGLVAESGRAKFINTYAAVEVIGSSRGGLVEENNGSTFTASFWDEDVAGVSTSAGGVAKTTAQMWTGSTFTGWDMAAHPVTNETWSICEGAYYPLLSWQLEAGFSCTAPTGFASLAFTNNALGMEAGTLGATWTVELRDGSGALLPAGALVSVSLRDALGNALLAGSTAVLSGLSTQLAMEGVATFENLSVNELGTYRLQATLGGVTATSEPFSVLEALAGFLRNDFLTFGVLEGCFPNTTDPDGLVLRGSDSDCGRPFAAAAQGPSVAPDGALGAPFYSFMDGADKKWSNLTYNQNPMEMAVTVGSTLGNLWLGGTDVAHSDYYDLAFEAVYFPWDVRPNLFWFEEGEFRVVTVTGGEITIGGARLEISHRYELPKEGSYIRATTTVKALSSGADAVRVFVGTYDDYIDGSDDTTKTRGNITAGGDFVPLPVADAAEPSNAVLIEGENAGILFYAIGGVRADAIIAEDYDLGDEPYPADDEINTFTEPGEIPVYIEDEDGAYMIAVFLGDIPSGESRKFDWYYAAGALDALTDIIKDVQAGAEDAAARDEGESNNPVNPPAPEVEPRVVVTLTDGASLLRNIPFTLVLSLVDEDGELVVAEEDVVVNLSASGGSEGGVLRRVGDLLKDPVVTLPAGASSVTISGLLYTGLSNPVGGQDVTLRVAAEGFEPVSVALSVRDSVLSMVASPVVVAPDGVSTAMMSIGLEDVQGMGIAGVSLTVSTTLGTLVDADGAALASPVVLQTNADGAASVRLQSSLVPGVATVSVSCPGACTRSTTVTFGSTEVSTPQDLLAVAGNRKIWLVFDPSGGAVVKYQYRLAFNESELEDAAWVDVSADAEQPYLVLEVPNDVEVFVQARTVGEDGPTLPSNTASVVPREIGEPAADLGVTGRDAVESLTPEDGKAVLEVPFTFKNTGSAALESVWLQESELISGGRVLSLSSERGTFTRYGTRWFWQGVNLAPDERVSGVITVEVEE